MSGRIIPEILRRQLGFGGVVLSDDMEMKAIAGRYPLEMQLDRATRATVDVFLCCKDPQLQLDVFEQLVRSQEEDSGFHRATEDSARRVHALRERFLKNKLEPVDLREVGCEENQQLALLARARGE
jgi:beta-N-acetylhexosaminidase